MSLKIYQNNCKNGDYHIGCYIGLIKHFYRTFEKGKTDLITSYVELTLDEKVNHSWFDGNSGGFGQ